MEIAVHCQEWTNAWLGKERECINSKKLFLDYSWEILKRLNMRKQDCSVDIYKVTSCGQMLDGKVFLSSIYIGSYSVFVA